MRIPPEMKPKLFLSAAIVAAVYIFFSGPLFIRNVPILLTQIFGVLLIVWAIISIRLNKPHSGSSTLPEGMFLVTKGPYEIIRHPIYAGVILFISGYVQGYPSLLRYLVFTVLFVALLMKLLYEEKMLEKHIKDFEAYKKKTQKLIPYLY